MSLKKFLRRVWEAIENLFENTLPEVKEAIHIGVVITERLNTIVSHPSINRITAAIPGVKDDLIVHIVRTYLPNIVIKLKLADACANETDPDKIILCAIKTLQSIEGDFKNDFLNALSIQIAKAASDGKLTWDEGAGLLKWYYDNRYKN